MRRVKFFGFIHYHFFKCQIFHHPISFVINDIHKLALVDGQYKNTSTEYQEAGELLKTLLASWSQDSE